MSNEAKLKNLLSQMTLDENTVMYRYNGESYLKHFSKDQMEALHLVIDALPESK